jgi:hypothetical protein
MAIYSGQESNQILGLMKKLRKLLSQPSQPKSDQIRHMNISPRAQMDNAESLEDKENERLELESQLKTFVDGIGQRCLNHLKEMAHVSLFLSFVHSLSPISFVQLLGNLDKALQRTWTKSFDISTSSSNVENSDTTQSTSSFYEIVLNHNIEMRNRECLPSILFIFRDLYSAAGKVCFRFDNILFFLLFEIITLYFVFLLNLNQQRAFVYHNPSDYKIGVESGVKIFEIPRIIRAVEHLLGLYQKYMPILSRIPSLVGNSIIFSYSSIYFMLILMLKFYSLS